MKKPNGLRMIDLVVAFVCLIGYLMLVTGLGYVFIHRFGLAFSSIPARLVFAYLLVETSRFLVGWSAGVVFDGGFVWSFLAVPLIGIAIVAGSWRSCDNADANQSTTSPTSKHCLAVVGGSFVVLTAFYLFAVSDQLRAAVSENGVIYQDIIYHAGLSRSIVNFGFPVRDLQFAGVDIYYHMLTHFMTSTLAYVSGLPEHLIYLTVLPVLVILMYCAVAYAFLFDRQCRDGSAQLLMHAGAIVLIPFVSVLGGGGIASTFVFSTLFSYSFALQLVVLSLLLCHFRSTGTLASGRVNIRILGIQCALLLMATITKGSSLPLVLAGYGTWFLASEARRFAWQPLVLLSSLFVTGVLTYACFFLGSQASATEIRFSIEQFPATLWSVILTKLSIDLGWLVSTAVLVIAFLSFRWLVFLRGKELGWFYAGMFVSGVTFYFFMSNNAAYFLFPALFVGTLLVVDIVNTQRLQMHWLEKAFVVGLLAFSTYPIASAKANALSKLRTKAATYIPVTPERMDLYRRVTALAPAEALLFTPSVYASSDGVADNYYPAAISGRQFWLGGYRFGGIKNHANFDARRALVDSFSLANPAHMQDLKSDGITHVLIEAAGNHEGAESWRPNSASHANAGAYELLFSNPAGALFRLR